MAEDAGRLADGDATIAALQAQLEQAQAQGRQGPRSGSASPRRQAGDGGDSTWGSGGGLGGSQQQQQGAGGGHDGEAEELRELVAELEEKLLEADQVRRVLLLL